MHIIIGLITALGVIALAFSRLYQAGKDGQEAVHEVRGAWRRTQWRSKSGRAVLDGLDDPREAAAAILVGAAVYDGALTQRQNDLLASQMREVFAVDAADADDLIAVGRHIHGQLNDVANVLPKLAAPIHGACTPDERAAFLQMLHAICEVEGPISDQQQELMNRVSRLLADA